MLFFKEDSNACESAGLSYNAMNERLIIPIHKIWGVVSL